jgi:hypothetical protein
LLSSGSRALERLQSLAPDRVPGLPFYRSRERLSVHTREKEKKKEKRQRGREP